MDSSKNSMNNDKNLCLFCDKEFSNPNDQENHVIKDHKTILKSTKGKGSRKSERITKNSAVEPFQGCFYCNNRKLSTRSNDLEALLQHLSTVHKDVYYVCKCRVRMQNKAALAQHKKMCKIGGGVNEFDGLDVLANEKANVKRRANKTRAKNETQSDSLSESEDTSSHHQPRTIAMNKKSENRHNSNSINSRKNYVTKKRNSKLPSSSSSTISSSSSKASDEYTIPLTRQKLKDPLNGSSVQKNRTSSSNKKSLKTSILLQTPVPIAENKNQHLNTSSSSLSVASKSFRAKSSKIVSNSQINVAVETVENGTITTNSNPSKSEVLNIEFDEDFYKKISCNIRVNLNCFIDGKADRLWNNKFKIEANSENNDNEFIQHDHDREIHEATNFEISTPPFPALLTAEQYGFGDSNPNKNKRQFTKNSWKWRWDLIKKYKYVNEGGKIVKKVKQITTGLKDLSQLDMWTQLSMRSRYENLNEQIECNEKSSNRMVKTKNIAELNGILDRRLTPEIHIEQLQQMLVKEELVEDEMAIEESFINETTSYEEELLKSLKLTKINLNHSQDPASLSGEWARPRCFVCIDCGQEFDLMKSLNDHKNSEHPYVVSAHYEVVGRENLEHKLYKNLFLPKKALNTIMCSKSISISSDSKSNEASSSSQDSTTHADQREKECTKCQKIIKYSNDIEIYRHILDCIEDKVWMQAKRRNKYRRSRRKPKKNLRKNQSRTFIEQKKSTSSPLNKDNTEGENSNPSISNPPTPKDDFKPSVSIENSLQTVLKPIKSSLGKNENFINGEERGNIKSFFRVSKTTPNLPQKMVVQMLQMPNTHNSNNHSSNSLKHSLRSSVKKQIDNCIINSSETITTLEEFNELKTTEGLIKYDDANEVKVLNNDLPMEEPNNSNQITPTLISLHIPTPEKCCFDLNSPTNSTTSSLVSPTSCSSVPKKKKKLNDCIAMLTCKIQEKLGVNFFEDTSNKIFPQENAASETEEKTISLSESIPNSNNMPIEYKCPEQEQVIDLSFKKASVTTNEMECKEILTTTDKTQTTIDLVQSHYDEEMIILSEDQNIISLDSFKISIAKEKIPELDNILEKQNIVGNDKFKISESERKAFEEQKNRIMQILGKKTSVKPRNAQINSKKYTQIKKTLKPKINTSIPKKNIVNKNASRGNNCNASKVNETTDNSHEIQTRNYISDKLVNEIDAAQEENQILKESITTTMSEIEINLEKIPKSTEKEEVIVTTFNNNSDVISSKKADLSYSNSSFIEEKIEQAIKTTNRIRCRRLSVVVDPMINMSSFQKNRKIRLTNNSQQNGFYDLLTNDQIFNAIKNTPTIRDGIKKLKEKAKEIKANVKKVINTKITKTKKKKSKFATGKVIKVTRKKRKTTSNKNVTKIEFKENNVQAINEEPKSTLKNETSKSQKLLAKKAVSHVDDNVKLMQKLQKEPIQSLNRHTKTSNQKNDDLKDEVVPKLQLIKKASQQTNISVRKNKLKIIQQEQERKLVIEPSSVNTTKNENGNNVNINSKIAPDNKFSSEKFAKKVPFRKTKIKKPSSTKNGIVNSFEVMNEKLDASSSDTSNEYDIPLAKLIPSVLLEKSKIQTNSFNDTPKDTEKNSEGKIKAKKHLHMKGKSNIVVNAVDVEKPSDITIDQKSLSEMNNKQKSEKESHKIVYMDKQILSKTKEETTNSFEIIPEISSQNLLPKKNTQNLSLEIEPNVISLNKSTNQDNYELLSINEDSFFNDDNDVDQANDKINALVNNIINSSELIDSENEKVDSLNNKQAKCFICNKSFKNEKVLLKHKKTSTHLLKEKRKEKLIIDKEALKISHLSHSDEGKIFRTKGALKTFDNILSTSSVSLNNDTIKHPFDEFKPIVEDSTSYVPLKESYNLEDDDEEELSTKDRIFDSLFSNIENKLQAAAKNEPLPKFDFPKISHQDSESSGASWDLKHDGCIDWNPGNTEIEAEKKSAIALPPVLENEIVKNESNLVAKSKLSKPKESIVPTKSLIMGKIFKKHRDREKQKTPQADAPNNKPGIKNSLDEIFDHLKNSAEIDDKVLTCPSPKTLLKNSCEIFSPHSNNSNDMLETASQSNNKNSKNKPSSSTVTYDKLIAKETDKGKISRKSDLKEEDWIGKRKSRRRCAIKMKTFAETWSSDEYEELHDTNDIMSIINEIEKREVSKNQKSVDDSEVTSILKSNENCNKKKVQLHLPNPIANKKIQNSIKESGHKSDEDIKTALPQKSQISLKKRRMSCFVPSTNFTSDVSRKRSNVDVKLSTRENLKMMTQWKSSEISKEKLTENKLKSNITFTQDLVIPTAAANMQDSCSSNAGTCMPSSAATQQLSHNMKKKSLKQRKRPRNKIKNIAYDSDSDFELNLSKKTKTASSTHYSESESNSENENKISFNEIPSKTHEIMKTIKEQPKLLPNDLNPVALHTNTSSKSTFLNHQQQQQMKKSTKKEVMQTQPSFNKKGQDNSCNRTKRHSSEKLYYWSSSSESDDIEQGDMPEGGENEEFSMIPQQPEQHGWIVGDSHKKLVTLLAHAKIKNKIN